MVPAMAPGDCTGDANRYGMFLDQGKGWGVPGDATRARGIEHRYGGSTQ